MLAHQRPHIERAARQLFVGRGLVVSPLRGALALAAIASAAGAPVSLREVRQSLFGACFPTDRDGWMVGELGRIFHTSDGGTTWERQDAGTKRPFLAIACLDARTAWIAGKEGIVYGTTDGGASWSPATTGSSRHLFGLAFANPDRGHGVGDYGTVVKGTDGGATCAAEPPPIELAANWIRSVWLGPGGQGFAVGAEGLVFRIDGGTLQRLEGRGPTRAL